MKNAYYQKMTDRLSLPVFIGAIFFLTFYLFYHQALALNGYLGNYLSDLPAHIGFAKHASIPTFEPGFHILFIVLAKIGHINYEIASSLILSTFYALFAVILYQIIKRELNLSVLSNIGICLASLLVEPIFMPFVNRTFYLLIGSPNIWHNPTIMMVKPFALYITYMFIIKLKDQELHFDKNYFILMFLLLFSCLFKPSYAVVFIPSIAIYGGFLLLFHPKFKERRLALFSYIAAFSIPSLLLLFFQYLALNKWGMEQNQHSPIIFSFFEVIKYYSNHYNSSGPLSGFLRVSAFPLSVALIINKNMSKQLLFCWLMFFIGYLQFAFFTQKVLPSDPPAGNLTWGFSIALSLLFIFSLIDFIKWFLLKKSVIIQYKNLKSLLISMLFLWCLISGIFYTCKVFLGGIYH